MVLNEVSMELQVLDQQIELIQNQLKTLPEGNLICMKCNNIIKWYVSTNGKRKYLRKKNRDLAISLAQKKYFSTLLQELLDERTFLQSHISFLSAPRKSEKLLQNPAYRNLLTSSNSIFLPHYTDDEINDWCTASFRSNPNHPETLIHSTGTGQYVRSKSEVLIFTCLTNHHIPFRYEAELVLDNFTIYPDFTILHPKKHTLLYWEHFGMVEKLDYRNHTIQKLSLYGNNQIFPSINLITTYETSYHPLGLTEIESLIQYHLLS